MEHKIEQGKGRVKVNLHAIEMGGDLLVRIFNGGAHVGAVAIGEYDAKNERASVSVITRLGHKDDAIARASAYAVSRQLKKTVCVVAGLHLEDISQEEIARILQNASELTQALLDRYQK